MSSLICQTIAAGTTDELRARRDAAVAADLVELRLDSVAKPDVRGALAGRRLPAIVTCRPSWDGGRFTGSEEERRRLLEEAIEAGAEYVDVEWRAGFAGAIIARRHGQGIVLSLHDFDGVPAHLGSLYAQMRRTGAQVVKIAVTARRLCDAFALENIGRSAGPSKVAEGGPRPDFGLRTSEAGGFVFIAMGAPGILTRIMPARFGSLWTYAGEIAPGQVSTDRLLHEFRFRHIFSTTAVYGVVGAGASASRSPALHNAAFAATGVDAVYVPLETRDFDDFLAFADRLPIAGASVTMPFKQDAVKAASEADEIACRVRAANTLRRIDAPCDLAPGGFRRWSATNTDVEGFLDPIRDVPLEGRRLAILGAGGAARAVAVAAAACGARVAVYARRLERAQAVARVAAGSAFEGTPDRGAWDVLVNATPVGSVPRVEETPIEAERLDGEIVYDLVYNPPVTRLLREARRAGCRTVGGLEMLVAQARRQSAWWTGQVPDADVLRAALGSGL